MTSSAPSAAVAKACDGATTVDLAALAGRWTIVSSSGKLDAGMAFRERVGETLTIEGTTLAVPFPYVDSEGQPLTGQMTKKLTLIPCTSPQAIDLDKPPDSKGWSRVGIIELIGNRMTLGVQFPHRPRPGDFLPGDDGREVVILERAPPPSGPGEP